MLSFPENVKHIGDAVSLGTVVAVLAKWLPEIAALGTVIWTVLRVYNEILEIRIKQKKLESRE